MPGTGSLAEGFDCSAVAESESCTEVLPVFPADNGGTTEVVDAGASEVVDAGAVEVGGAGGAVLVAEVGGEDGVATAGGVAGESSNIRTEVSGTGSGKKYKREAGSGGAGGSGISEATGC